MSARWWARTFTTRRSGDGGIGGGARIHVEGQRRPAAVSPGYVARVKLEGVDDDREFVAFVRRVRALAVDPAVGGVLFKIEGMKLGDGAHRRGARADGAAARARQTDVRLRAVSPRCASTTWRPPPTR